MPVTMRDVAAKVGVSKQTVSAVLNRKPGISAETTARVWAAIAELGYQPNLVASSLRHGSTRMIGLLVTNVANPWFAEMVCGVEDVAQARGYSVMLCNTYDDPARTASYIQVLKQNNAASILGGVEASVEPPSAVPLGLASLEADNLDQRGAFVATAHLLDLGHTRIACISAPLHSWTGINRLYGYKAALAEYQVAYDPLLTVEGTLDYSSGIHAMERLLALPERPTAIFAHQDLLAIGAMSVIKRAGLRIPEDIAIIGYDGIEIAALYDPPLSTIIQPIYEMGRQTMIRVADQLEKRNPPSELPPLDCLLAVRRSTVAGLHEEWCSPPIASGTPWQDWRTQKG